MKMRSRHTGDSVAVFVIGNSLEFPITQKGTNDANDAHSREEEIGNFV